MAHFAAGAFMTAGQANTIAHQGIQLIEEKVLDADTGVVTFTDIPQTYQSLWMVVSAGVSDTAVRVFRARFNGDAAASYTSQRFGHVGDGTTATAYDDAATSVGLGIINTNLLAQNSIMMPGYARTDREKSCLSTFAAPGSPADRSSVGFCGGAWHSTSAITQIELAETLFDGSRPILAGSIFTLYGLGGASASA